MKSFQLFPFHIPILWTTWVFKADRQKVTNFYALLTWNTPAAPLCQSIWNKFWRTRKRLREKRSKKRVTQIPINRSGAFSAFGALSSWNEKDARRPFRSENLKSVFHFGKCKFSGELASGIDRLGSRELALAARMQWRNKNLFPRISGCRVREDLHGTLSLGSKNVFLFLVLLAQRYDAAPCVQRS